MYGKFNEPKDAADQSQRRDLMAVEGGSMMAAGDFSSLVF